MCRRCPRGCSFIGLASILPFPSQAHATGAKRAFNRAVQRARAHPQQGTFYRGRWCKLTHLAPQPGSSPQTSHKPRLHGAAASTATRLHGLTGEAYQELLQWLQKLPPQNQPSIVHVQETHWTTSQEFTTPGWFHDLVSVSIAKGRRAAHHDQHVSL